MGVRLFSLAVDQAIKLNVNTVSSGDYRKEVCFRLEIKEVFGNSCMYGFKLFRIARLEMYVPSLYSVWFKLNVHSQQTKHLHHRSDCAHKSFSRSTDLSLTTKQVFMVVTQLALAIGTSIFLLPGTHMLI